MIGFREEDSAAESEVAPEYISVHALGKFEFCTRAGILAFESERSDEDDDWEKTPRLDYMPIFEIAKLNEELAETKSHLNETRWLLLVTLVVAIIVGWLISRTLCLLLLPAVIVLGRKMIIHSGDYRELTRLQELEKKAHPVELGEPGSGQRRIDWWGLSKNKEFKSTILQENLVSESLNLVGRPARLAEYRHREIPVILHFGELERAKPYHLARLAAYALLSDENSKGAMVEWGIILNPHTMKGLAVPISNEAKKEVRAKLEEFRWELQQTKKGSEPPAPPSSYCYECPYGRPRHFSPPNRFWIFGQNKQQSENLPFDAMSIRNGNRYHSPCGDRFEWLPPHNLVELLGIRRR